MKNCTRTFFLFSLITVLAGGAVHLAGQAGPADKPTAVLISTPLAPPAWALAEREMLQTAAGATKLWVERYLRPDGSVNVPERWGVTDGPDDIMETVRGWPLIYAMGAPDAVADAALKSLA